MKKKYKIFMHSIDIVMSNKIRYFLTAIGLIVSIYIYTLGSVLSYSFSYKDINEYMSFDKSTVFINHQINNKQRFELEKKLTSQISYYSYYTSELFKFKNEDVKYEIDLQFDVLGVNKDFLNNPVPSLTNDKLIINNKIIKGRTFTDEDFLLKKRVIIINQYFADLIFGEGKGLGKTINLYNNEFLVIGIMSDTNDILDIKKNIDKSYKNHNNYTAEAYIYIPMSLLHNTNNYKYTVIRDTEDTEKIATIADTILKLNSNKSITYIRLVQDKIENVYSTQLLLQVLMALFLLISTTSISVIMFFSMKERVNEIGIKKAIGAEDEDIVIEFLFESLIIGNLTGIIGIVTGILSAFIVVYIIGLNFISFNIYIILVPYLLSLIIIIISSFIPSLIATKNDIVKSLKFD